jgi:hypothetical protein
VICDAFTAERIGANALLAAVAPSSDFGRRAWARFTPFGPGAERAATTSLERVVALAARLDADGVAAVRAAIRAVPDPAPLVARARSGDPLADVDFYELGRFVDGVDRVRAAYVAAGGDADDAPPATVALRTALAPGKTTYGFALADAFDSILAPARETLDAAQARLDAATGTARDRVAAALGTRPKDDEFVVLRGVASALPPQVRVVRETPTYLLCALVLDGALLAATTERDAANAALARVEDAVRARLADTIAAERDAIAIASEALGTLDAELARVAFTQRYGGCVPRFAADRIVVAAATFVPLRDALAAAGRTYVPLAFAFDGVAVLTGPNMGGKSAALATLGFLTLCAAYGVPPPADAATFPLVARIAWLGGESPDDRKHLLSAFGADVVRASAILRDDAPRLVLADEFARTTGPREGRALVVAFLRALARRGVTALVATHFDRVADAAGVAHLAVAGIDRAFARAATGVPAETGDLAAALATIAEAMDYRIVAVTDEAPEGSDALALAQVLGLADDAIADARRIYDEP